MTELVADPPAQAPAARPGLALAGQLGSLAAATRPRQWVENGLVLAAPLAAGALLRPQVVGGVALAFIAFVCASAAVYLGNDVADRERDRHHPRKAHRAIAAGLLSPPLAVAAAVVLAALAVGGPVALGNAQLAVVVAAYLGSSAGYTLLGKHVPPAGVAAD